MPKSRLLIVVLLWMGLVNCTHDPVVPDSPQLTFESDIKAITINNCARSGCHDHGGEEPTLITYADVVGLVSPGNPNKSKLYKVITKLSGEEAMPPGGPLTNDQIKTIYVWILQGANEK